MSTKDKEFLFVIRPPAIFLTDKEFLFLIRPPAIFRIGKSDKGLVGDRGNDKIYVKEKGSIVIGKK